MIYKKQTRRRTSRGGGARAAPINSEKKQEIATFLRNKNRTNQMEISWSHLDGIPLTSDMFFEDVIIRDSDMVGFSFARDGAGADFTGIQFLNCTMENCDFTGANLKKLTIAIQKNTKKPTLNGCIFDGVNLDGVFFENVTIKNTSFRGAKLSGEYDAYLEIRSMVNVSFAGAELNRAMFVKTDKQKRKAGAYNVDFTGAMLNETKFIELEFYRSKFSGADLTAAEFNDCIVDSVTNASITTDRNDIHAENTAFHAPASSASRRRSASRTPVAVPVELPRGERFAFLYGPDGPERLRDDADFIPAAKRHFASPRSAATAAQRQIIPRRTSRSRTTSDLSPATNSPVVAELMGSFNEDDALFGRENDEFYDFNRDRPMDIVRARKLPLVHASPYSASKMSRRKREHAANVIKRAVKTRRRRSGSHAKA